jgi:hypothetical protein
MPSHFPTRARLDNQRRVVASTCGLLGSAAGLYCGFAHYCACGHLAHTNAIWWPQVLDIAANVLIAVAAVLSYRSNMRFRLLLMVPAALLLVGMLTQLNGCVWLPVAVVCLLASVLGFVLPRRRPMTGHCQECDYDLTGNISGRCPECGTPVSEAPEGKPAG